MPPPQGQAATCISGTVFEQVYICQQPNTCKYLGMLWSVQNDRHVPPAAATMCQVLGRALPGGDEKLFSQRLATVLLAKVWQRLPGSREACKMLCGWIGDSWGHPLGFSYALRPLSVSCNRIDCSADIMGDMALASSPGEVRFRFVHLGCVSRFMGSNLVGSNLVPSKHVTAVAAASKEERPRQALGASHSQSIHCQQRQGPLRCCWRNS